MPCVLHPPGNCDTSGITCRMQLEQLFQQHPEAIPVFLKHHVNCIGCPFAKFHTLGDVIRLYHLNPELFMKQIRATIAEHPDDSNK